MESSNSHGDLHHIVAMIGGNATDFDVAHSLAEARIKLAQESYNLVVLDIGLPDGSGWELLPQLKALDPEPPVIVLSGAEPTRAQQAAVQSTLVKSNDANQARRLNAMTLKRILYAEDEPDIQAVAKLALEMVGGFKVLICGNGAETLEKVTDIDGPTALQKLRADPATASIPVIFLTAKVQPPEVAQYQSMGAINVIAKPFDPMTLAAQVNQIWEARHGCGAEF